MADATKALDEKAPAPPRIRWDHSEMRTTYANVCNVTSTREEVTLLFGTNQTFLGEQSEFLVRLSDRIIVSPFAAKRLAKMLENVVGEYERRFGALPVDVPGGRQ